MTAQYTKPASRHDSKNASVVDVPFELRSPAGVTSAAQPVSGGLCLPRGRVFDVRSASVCGESFNTPAQTEVLSRWSDGSIRWLLSSWVAEAALPDGSMVLQLNAATSDSVQSEGDATRTNLRRTGHRFLVQQSQSDGSVPSFTEFEVAPQLTLSNGSVGEFEFGEVAAEVEGPIRSVYTAQGTLVAHRHISLQLRFEVWPSLNLVQVHARLLNSRRARHRGGLWDLGDPGSFVFDGLSIDAGLQGTADTDVRWKVEVDSEVRRQRGCDPLCIAQIGSGGAAWAGTNHVGADGVSTVYSRGYAAIGIDGTVRGYRSEPAVVIESDDLSLSVAIPEFWQKFPSSIVVNDGVLSAGLFSQNSGPHELQGGEQSTQSIWLSTRSQDEQLSSLDWITGPARMIQSADWVQQAGVFDWFSGTVHGEFSDRYSRWLSEVTSGDRSVTGRRETIDEYGWRNFGDVHADHEQTHYAGSNTIVSHYNNQFDLIYGGILNMMVSGDAAWLDLFDPLARHVMDIDIYHTDEDRAGFNGGLFWHTDHYVDARTATHRTYSRHNCPQGGDYGGGPSNEHNYATGLVYYYYLTGNPEAIAAVRSLGDWVINVDDGRQTVFGLVDDGPTGGASATIEDSYHGPGRGSGNSISVLLDAWELTKEDRYLNKAEELIRRVVHPEQDIAALDLLNAEYRWSYTVCLTSCGRYLAKMDEAGRRGPMYDYVRRTLCHFGRWMLEQERPTLSHPEGLEFVTEAWAAQEFRKANVLRIAASCCDDLDIAGHMRTKADELNDAAWRDLYEFGDKHLTARCFSIVMTEGLRDVFHRRNADHQTAQPDEAASDGEWTMFVPQRTRVKQRLKAPRELPRTLMRLCSVSRWLRTLDALRRRM